MTELELDLDGPIVEGISTSRATLPGRVVKGLVREGECLVWTGQLRAGYGVVSVWEDGRSRLIEVHRVTYEMTKGAIPEGMYIDHLCRNPRCADPYHLEVVSPGENTHRGKLFHHRTHCGNGHRYTFGSYTIRQETGAKVCKECLRDQRRRRYLRRRAAETSGES